MLHLDDIVTKEIVPGLFGKFLHGEKSTLAVWDIKKGSVLPEHYHENEQITYILEGELQMTIGEVTTVFKAGNLQVIPSNVPHSALALTDCKVVDAWAPPRDAYR